MSMIKEKSKASQLKESLRFVAEDLVKWVLNNGLPKRGQEAQYWHIAAQALGKPDGATSLLNIWLHNRMGVKDLLLEAMEATLFPELSDFSLSVSKIVDRAFIDFKVKKNQETQTKIVQCYDLPTKDNDLDSYGCSGTVQLTSDHSINVQPAPSVDHDHDKTTQNMKVTDVVISPTAYANNPATRKKRGRPRKKPLKTPAEDVLEGVSMNQGRFDDSVELTNIESLDMDCVAEDTVDQSNVADISQSTEDLCQTWTIDGALVVKPEPTELFENLASSSRQTPHDDSCVEGSPVKTEFLHINIGFHSKQLSGKSRSRAAYMRERRLKVKLTDPDARSACLQRERERYWKRKAAGLVKTIHVMSDDEKEKQKQKWREAKRMSRMLQKQREAKQRCQKL